MKPVYINLLNMNPRKTIASSNKNSFPRTLSIASKHILLFIEIIQSMEGVSVFIPAYNEQQILKTNTLKLISYLRGLGRPFEAVIVDDASTDATRDISLELADDIREIKYIRCDVGPTYRGNLYQILPEAEYEIIAYLDADLSTPLRFLNPLITFLDGGYDIVVGSRHLSESRIERGVKRRMASDLFKHFMRLYFGSEIRDHECGFKAFKKEKLLPLLKEMEYDGVLPRKMFYDAELLLRAQIKDYLIKEMPISWRESEKSAVSLWDQLLLLPYALTLRFRL
ncbi:MAG: glycosyltransferase [Candidatus Altiarchaeales archaeon]|nr:glycosyltransferase [Candidatus Altiarchaeales archaeon]